MRRIRNRVAGLDVHRDSVTACVEIFDGVDVEVTKQRFSTTARGIRELADWLATFEVELVVMEATGVYWKPVYYGLEDLFDEVWLVNAHHVKNVPGRKTDMSDAQWLADVAAHGMVRPSMVPPPRDPGVAGTDPLPPNPSAGPRCRDPTTREAVAGCRDQAHVGGVEGVVQVQPSDDRDADLRPRRPGRARRAGEGSDAIEDPGVDRSPGIAVAAPPHVVARRILAHIDFLDEPSPTLSDEIVERLRPFESLISLWTTIPGVSTLTAQIMVAEIGADMDRFPTAGHLASWAGVAPASYESAGKRRPAGTRHGSRHLRQALIEAARAASRTKGTFLAARYSRIARRRGPNKAAVAIAHTILVSAWHMATTGETYVDLGEDFYTQRQDPARRVNHHVRQLEAAGYTVTLTPAA